MSKPDSADTFIAATDVVGRVAGLVILCAIFGGLFWIFW